VLVYVFLNQQSLCSIDPLHFIFNTTQILRFSHLKVVVSAIALRKVFVFNVINSVFLEVILISLRAYFFNLWFIR